MSTTNINLYYNDSIEPYGVYYAMDIMYEESPKVSPSERSVGKNEFSTVGNYFWYVKR
jgi:hypothetical protein